VRLRHLALACLWCAGTALTTVQPAEAGATASSGSCGSSAASAARDCVIRGVVSGQYRYFSATDDQVTKWSGTIVLRLASKADDRRYVISSGSSVTWSISGHAAGCTVSGSGTLGSGDLQGGLGITELIRPGALARVMIGKQATNRVRLVRPGLWAWQMAIDSREPRAGETLMPVTYNCGNGGSNTVDVAVGFAKGYQFADTELGSGSTATTDGITFNGSRGESGAATETKATFRLMGNAFADQISTHGLQLIKTWEGWMSKAYDDSVGNCTIGYGTLLHLGPCTKAEQKLVWTKQRADAALPQLVKQAKYEGQIAALSRAYGLNQCQFDALTSFVYNTGGIYALTQGLPRDGWEGAIATRLPKYVTAKNRSGSTTKTTVDRKGKVSLTFKDPQTGKLVTLPPGTKLGAGGATVTDPATGKTVALPPGVKLVAGGIVVTDPATGKTYTVPAGTATRTGPSQVTLAGLVQRRTAELRLFTTPSCPCQGVRARTPSTVGKP
jgi:GH24 family phage-related lysozyme (muramidase)